MSVCFKTEYDEDGNDIWANVKFSAPPEGFKEPPSKELDKKVQLILAKVKAQGSKL